MTPELWRLWLPLIIILMICLSLAWLLQRWQHKRQGINPLLKLRGSLALGPRERIAIIEVGGQWLVVGITPHNMSLLHSLPATGTTASLQKDNESTTALSTWLNQHQLRPE